MGLGGSSGSRGARNWINKFRELTLKTYGWTRSPADVGVLLGSCFLIFVATALCEVGDKALGFRVHCPSIRRFSETSWRNST